MREPSRARMQIVAMAIAVALLVQVRVAVAVEPVWKVMGGDARRAPKLIGDFGCGSCHVIPGIMGARGNVGPPLTRFGERSYIAGMLTNTPTNLIRWLRDPQGVVPGNAMPNMGINDAEARDIAAYLYTLR